MGDDILGKFIYFWIFLIGGLFAAKIFGIADTAGNMVVLSISLAFIYVGWNFLRAKSKKNAAAKQAASTPANRSGQNKRKKKKK